MGLTSLAGLHLDVLYERNAEGAITAVRGTNEPVPFVHLVRTREGNVFALSSRLPSRARDRLANVLAREGPLSDCASAAAHPPNLAAIRAVLHRQATRWREHRGPAYFFPDALAHSAEAGLLTNLCDAPSEGRFGWLRTASAAAQPIAAMRAEAGQIVAVCHSARSSSLAAEAGVETADDHRRRGYGAAAVTTWAHAVRASGLVPLYSTNWENGASLALARRLGLVCYAEDLHIG